MSSKKKGRVIAGLILWLSVSVSFGSFSVFAAAKKEAPGERVVKIGIVGDAADQWKPVITKLAAEGVKIELVEFTEYVQPNRALQDGEIDLNSFQHYAYFDNEIKTKGNTLTPIGETLLAPLGLFSQKIKSVSEIRVQFLFRGKQRKV